MGKVATSPLPPRGSPPLQSGGAKSELAHKWARWLHQGSPTLQSGGQNQKWGKVATSPLPPRGSPPLQSGGQNQKWPINVGKVATSPCRLIPSRLGDLQSGGQNQKWPINGQGGYITPAASGIPTASKRGAKSEVAHKWARWLHHPCRLGDPLRFKAGGKIRSGP